MTAFEIENDYARWMEEQAYGYDDSGIDWAAEAAAALAAYPPVAGPTDAEIADMLRAAGLTEVPF